MSEEGKGSKAAEIAARQVESIVAVAEATAAELAEQAARQAEEIRAKGRADAARHMDEAREQAAQLREEARRQIEERLAIAEEAASQVLEEAQVLSSGLRQLGSSLQSQGERILRDVQAAHRRMQADLRVSAPAPDELPVRRAAAPEPRGDRGAGGSTATPEERAALERAAAELRDTDRGSRRGRPGRLELDVPAWVERED